MHIVRFMLFIDITIFPSQDALFFMKTYFAEISSGPDHAMEAELAGGSTESDTPKPSTPPPVMQVYTCVNFTRPY